MKFCMNVNCHLMREHYPSECGWPAPASKAADLGSPETPRQVKSVAGASFDPTNNCVPFDQGGYAPSVMDSLLPAVSLPEDAAPPVDLEALIQRMHVIIGETKRCIDDDRLLRAQDKLNYLDGLVCAYEPPAVLAVPDGRLRQLIEHWRNRADQVPHPTPEMPAVEWRLRLCADELEALLAPLASAVPEPTQD